MKASRKGPAGLLAAVLAVLACTGCGEGEAPSSGKLDLLIADCSVSFRASSMRLLPEMVAIARDSAAKERVLWSGCFAGAPLRKLRWKVREDFGEYPDGVNAGTPLADSFNQARAIGMRKELEAMVVNTKQSVGGSGQLEALEVASEAPELGRVFLFTDAAIHQPQVPELYTASPADIRETAELWAPRLRGLQGVELIMLGVGYGVHNSKSVRAARMLFRELAKRVGAASFEWTQQLPPRFPSS